MSNERPCSVAEAIARMKSMVGMPYPYELATGDYSGETPVGPWDCAGAALCEALKIKRHRPGFAKGPLPVAWARFADVEDDINTNSAIKDALIHQELFRFVRANELLEPGDFLAYPTIYLRDEHGDLHRWIGHVQMVLEPAGAFGNGPFRGVKIAHAHGLDGRVPAVEIGFATKMDEHNAQWSKPYHKAWALRLVP